MITHVSPLGSMDMLSQLEVDMLKRTASSDLYQLFRNCSLAVLNSGSLTDNSKELLSRFENFDINVNQSRSASGVYTGLLCWHECDDQESASCGRRKMQQRSVSRICDTGDIPLPRSLTRCARSFGCGERYRLTGGAEVSGKMPGRDGKGKREGRGEAVFP